MEDHEFFDLLYNQWTKTTGASDTYWMPERFEDQAGNKMPWFVIWSVGADKHKHEVANDLDEVDAEWITGVHGCFGDLVRRMHEALDEADRLDLEKDELISRIFELEAQVDELTYELHEVGM